MKIFTLFTSALSLRINSFLMALALLFLLLPYPIDGQARAVGNPGLEFGMATEGYGQLDANFGFGSTFDAGSASTAPWYTSHQTESGQCAPGFSGDCHPVEVWGSYFQSVPAAEGNNFVELNAFVSSMIYQNLYLTTGDVINYFYRHRARSSSAEQASMRIEDQDQVLIATVNSTAAPASLDAWSVNQGTYTFTGAAGIYRVGFRALVDGGSPGLGNLLDDVRITMVPLIDLKFSYAVASCEGSGNGNLFLRINGAIAANTVVAVQLVDPSNGTAFISDSDITVTGIANSNGTPTVSHTPGSPYYLITVPAGNYDGGSTPGYSSPGNNADGVALNIASVNDATDEPAETFKFEIKAQGTNGSTNNFRATASPVFGDVFYPSTGDYLIQECVCYNSPNTAIAGVDSRHGITLLKRAGTSDGNWPMIRKSAHTVLESNTKGFVITRLSTAQVTALVSPQEGMMVYDTDAKCLKLYDGSAWSCFTTPTCPAPNVNAVSSVTSATGKVWMDRNLGATQVATSLTDAAAYGDLYQWGRGADGHQLRTSGTTTVLSSTNVPGHGDFIVTDYYNNYDWRSTPNNNLWQGVNGINNPCPGGYRLPTITELTNENSMFSTYDAAGAFASPLKLPAAGYREVYDGSLYSEGDFGIFWSSTVSYDESEYFTIEYYGNYNIPISRGYGFSVRCIKD